MRSNLRNEFNTIDRRNRKTYLFYFIFATCGYFLCDHFGKDGVEAKNYYTINHVNFNKDALRILAVNNGLLVVLNLLVKNAGFRSRIKCIDIIWALFLILVRIAIIGYIVINILPQVVNIMQRAWNLDHLNWWQSEDESFFTNASSFNAIMCWYLWACYQILNWIIIIYGTILILIILVNLMKNG